MTDANKCPRCGTEFPANFPAGVCPACLLKQGLSPSTFESVADIGNGRGGSPRRRGWIPPTPEELAPRFPQLEIVALLGQGGMGAVYKVRQRDLDRWAALKVLPDDVAHDPTFAERFQREARALALLGHQHIVIVYEFGQRDGVYYLLMEYIDGVTLRQAIRARQITDRDALNIVMQVCEALQFAHEEGVVHRDIKPENILIDKRGRVKIADFGLAKLLGQAFEVHTLTGTHQVMGTPVYMAPEQMEGTRGVDHRADIFSLGVVFYELLTGELPLGRFAPPSQKYQLDVRLDEVVLRTLEKEPDRRYQQASDVKCDVESIRSQPSVPVVEKPQRRMRSFGLWRPSRDFSVDGVKTPRKRWTWRKRFVVLLFVIGGLFFAAAFSEAKNRSRQLEMELARLRQSERALINQPRNQRVSQRETPVEGPLTPLPLGFKDGQRQLEAASQDPNEANAVVQFTSEGPKLNHLFGRPVLDARNVDTPVAARQIVNSLLATVHQEFLSIESRHVTWEAKNDETQVAVIERFDDEIRKLENWFWTAIDTRLPVNQQKFLRQHLPLFADGRQELPLVRPGQRNAASTGGLVPASSPKLTFQPNAGGFTGNVQLILTNNSEIKFPSNFRYMQLFGWNQEKLTGNDSERRKQDLFPIRVTIGRQGNWYRWSIDISQDVMGEISYVMIDSGYDPELPSGLRRFWRDDKASTETANLATAEPTPHRPLDPANESNNPEASPIAIAVAEPAARLKTLEEELKELEGLQNNPNPDDEIAAKVEELLKRYPRPTEMGWIYGRAASLFAQNDFVAHHNEVVSCASAGLRWESDPIERGRLFSLIGKAAEASDDDPNHFVECRLEATRWYLKGYAELRRFLLPQLGHSVETDAVPPSVKVRYSTSRGEYEQADFLRQLVDRRDAYLERLKDLYGPLHEQHDRDASAQDRFDPIATEVLDDPKEVEKLRDALGIKPVEKPTGALSGTGNN